MLLALTRAEPEFVPMDLDAATAPAAVAEAAVVLTAQITDISANGDNVIGI